MDCYRKPHVLSRRKRQPPKIGIPAEQPSPGSRALVLRPRTDLRGECRRQTPSQRALHGPRRCQAGRHRSARTVRSSARGTGIGSAPASTLSESQTATPAAASSSAIATETAPAATPDASSLIGNPEGEKELVLIIDDEETIVTYVTETLKSDGYRVIGCTSPFEAIKAYKQFKDSIALVILDYTLPIMNGREVFDELRSMNPCVAVMLSSGFAEQKDVNSMLAIGLRGFLPKPYTQERLLSQVRSTIVGSRSGNSAAPVTVSPTTPLVPVPAGAPETV